jgi:hypothetical protein
MNKQKEFFELLFDKGEGVGLVYQVHDTRVMSRDDLWLGGSNGPNYFSINPLKEYRNDKSVTCFRNFLIEFDNGSLFDQIEWLKIIPVSTIVYSGNKSMHAIISLQEPCANRAEYDTLAARILKKVPQADPTARNPSRLSRSPEVTRFLYDRYHLQELKFLGKRITRNELDSWLGPAPAPSVPTVPQSKLKGVFSAATSLYLMDGAPEGQRNATLFKAAADLTRAGYAPEQIMELVMAICDLPLWEIKRTIASAAKAASAT